MRVSQMDWVCFLRARSLWSRRYASSCYEVWLLYDHLRRWLGRPPATTLAMNAKLKAYGFAPFAVLLAAVFMVWSGAFAWYHLNRLRNDLSVVQSSSFHLAEHVPEKMLALNATLRALGFPPDPAVMADFQRQAAEMKLWVRTNRLSVTSAPQRDVLDRIEAVLDDYVVRTTRIVEENTRVASGAKPKSVRERVEQEASPIPALALELRAAEQAALDRFVKDSRRSLGNLYYHVLVSVGVALVLGLAALRLIHVARIAPLEAKLAQSHSLLEQQEKLAALGTLAAGVAHEVRNPLTAIKLRLNSLKRATPGNPSATDDLAVINYEIKRLERIVGDVLQFARPPAPRRQTFAARTLFEQLQHLLGPQLEAAGIRLQIEAPPGISVWADSQQVQQVLINLVQNAADNTPRAGSITLRAGACKARFPSGTAPGTILEVADTGKGIAPEVAKRLFDPFFSTKPTGAGLGLSIAARIVHQHGGLIQYQTTVGHGTTFSVILPNAAESQHAT
jgi:signal transduction histidine kinase